MKNLTSILLFLFLCPFTSFGQAGMLDASFNGSGILTANLAGNINVCSSIDIRPDGKILAAFSGGGGDYDIMVARFLPNGQLDSTFANGEGLFQLSSNLGPIGPDQIEILDDGSMLVCGSYKSGDDNYDFLLMKLDSNGVLDPNFGVDGLAIHQRPESNDHTEGMLLLPDGKIIVYGKFSILDPFWRPRAAMIRFDANGLVDSTFGTNGIFVNSPGIFGSIIYKLLLFPDGDLLMLSLFNSGYGLYKIKADGSGSDSNFTPDPTYLRNYFYKGEDIVLHPNGKILVAGTYDYAAGGIYNMAIFAYDLEGKIDPTFGENGVFNVNRNYYSEGNQIVVQPDGKIIVGGRASIDRSINEKRTAFTARCDENGELDTSWGSAGFTKHQLSPQYGPQVRDMMLQPDDGKLLIAGGVWTANAGANDLLIMRFNNVLDTMTTSITPISDEETIHFFPNPATERLIVNSKSWGSSKVQIQFFTPDGKRLKSEEAWFENGQYEIKLTGLPDGLLFVRLQSSQGFYTRSIIKH